MSEGGSSGIAFTIPVRQKEKKPEMKHVVSSLFARPTPAADPPKKPIVQKNPKPTRPQAAADASAQPKESGFLRMLRSRQEGQPPPQPVPTAAAFNPHVPIAGFGKATLRDQELELGQSLGKT
jgi:hypothetical protein